MRFIGNNLNSISNYRNTSAGASIEPKKVLIMPSDKHAIIMAALSRLEESDFKPTCIYVVSC